MGKVPALQPRDLAASLRCHAKLTRTGSKFPSTLRPNRSLELTANGWPLRVAAHHALRGQPLSAAQLQR
jgi:hypothetical protein